MSDIGCPGRKLQVRGDLLVSEEDPQKWKPQKHHREQGRYDKGPSHGPSDWKYIFGSFCAQPLIRHQGVIHTMPADKSTTKTADESDIRQAYGPALGHELPSVCPRP